MKTLREMQCKWAAPLLLLGNVSCSRKEFYLFVSAKIRPGVHTQEMGEELINN